VDIEKERKKTLKSKGLPTKNAHTKEAAQKRIEFLEKELGLDLDIVAETKLKSELVKGNIENFFGTIEIPLGLAGPLRFDFEDGPEDLFAPLATTEGALVASVCRGAKAISLSGGVRTFLTRSVMTRSPLFQCKNMSEAFKVYDWFERNFSLLKDKCGDYSNYIELLRIVPKYGASGVGIRFEYETGDASGQNMSTVCTWNLAQWALEEMKLELNLPHLKFLIEGGHSSDKKISFASTIEGRGKEVFAEALIKKRVVERILKINVKEYVKGMNQCRAHSALAGGMGFQINVANILAGIFTATGQDIACVHESATANFYVEETDEGDLQVSIQIPNLLVGTVGGGVSLPGPKSMLELMDCYGPGKVERFAKIIAGFGLALELSTSTAVGNGSFAQAHDRLGRNRGVDWLKFSEINENFFNENCELDEKIESIERDKSFSTDKSLVSDLVSPITRRVAGIYKYRLNSAKPHDVVLKVKPLDEEVNLALLMLAGLEDMSLKEVLQEYRPYSLFKNCHIKEQKLHDLYGEKFASIFPKNYGSVKNHEREIYALVSEYLHDYKFIDFNNAKFFKNEAYIKNVISSITPFHAINYNKDLESYQTWMTKGLSIDEMISLQPVWSKSAGFAYENFPEIVSLALYQKHLKVVNGLGSWKGRVETLAKTLIHFDFNPRNIGYRPSDGSVKIIDWELASVGLPQRDIIELLAYTTDESLTKKDLGEIIRFHKREFEFSLQEELSDVDWEDSYRYALEEFLVHRLPLYFVAHAHKECEFLPGLYTQTHHLIELMKEF